MKGVELFDANPRNLDQLSMKDQQLVIAVLRPKPIATIDLSDIDGDEEMTTISSSAGTTSPIATAPALKPLEELPAYIFSTNLEYYDMLFDLLGGEHSELAWSLLMRLPTNAVTLNQVKTLTPKSLEWNSLLQLSNPFKLVYHLQIIEKIILPEPNPDLANVEKAEEAFIWIDNFRPISIFRKK